MAFLGNEMFGDPWILGMIAIVGDVAVLVESSFGLQGLGLVVKGVHLSIVGDVAVSVESSFGLQGLGLVVKGVHLSVLVSVTASKNSM